MTSSFVVSPSRATGNNRRIELAGMDLWTWGRVDRIYVYPSEIQIDRFQEALSRTLSLWPLVAGRILIENDGKYIIEMCDGSIPVTLIVNNDLREWPLDSNVVLDVDNQVYPAFIDQVDVKKVLNNPSDEPLVRFKLTHIVQSNEWVLGISWYHLLSDAAACLHFCNTLSRFYRGVEAPQPSPIFERRLWREDEANQSVLPIAKLFLDPQPMEEASKITLTHQSDYEQLNLHFSGAQLATLRTLAGGKSITIQDTLTAYIILTLNTSCYQNNNERRILRATNVVNIHGISDLIARKGEVSNCLFMMTSDDFDDPYSLSNIAKTIRQSIVRLRDCQSLESVIATVDGLMRKNAREKKIPNPQVMPNEFGVNSNYKNDWANLVDFGYRDQCRIYTIWSHALLARVFRLNPEKDENKWLPRDPDGAEAAFRIEKHWRDQFLNAFKRDILENFQNIKK